MRGIMETGERTVPSSMLFVAKCLESNTGGRYFKGWLLVDFVIYSPKMGSPQWELERLEAFKIS